MSRQLIQFSNGAVVPTASSNELYQTSVTGTVEISSAQWGDMTVAFEKLSPQDFGATPYPSYHCGFLFSGKMVVRYTDREETIQAGQAFYMQPGHLQKVVEACEEVVFTPSAQLRELLDAERRNA